MSQADNKPSITLKTQVQAKVASEQLSVGQVRQLMAMQQVNSHKPIGVPATASSTRLHWKASLAASMLVLVAAFSIWSSIDPRPSLPDDLTQSQSALYQQIAMEVVKNHIKLKPLDIQTQSIAEIQQFFKQLDFAPISSQQLTAPRISESQGLLGGRYCSIKGITAAQLRYQQNTRGLSTLYQVGYDIGLFGEMPVSERGESPRTMFVQGLKVSMWVEKGLLMVLVANPLVAPPDATE